MDLISRLRRRQAFGSTDGAHWLRLAAPDQDCQDAADEIERLKHDIERHIAICGTQEQDIERLQQRVAELYRAQKNDYLSLQINGETIARLTRERDAAVAALEIIAGKRQCVDNLMSNVEIARCALEQEAQDNETYMEKVERDIGLK